MAVIHFSSRTKTVLIWAAILIALAFLFTHATLVTPFAWALITAFILNAIVQFAMGRVGGPRWVWVLAIYFGLVAGLIWGLISVVPVFAGQLRALLGATPTYIQQIEQWLQAVNFQFGNVTVSSHQVADSIRQALNDFMGGLSSRAPQFVLLVFERLLTLLLYLVATFYFLLQTDRLVAAVRAPFPSDVLDELDPWIRRINSTLGRYLRGQALLITIISVATFIGLQVLGVRFALALAIMSGIVETVPYLGPYAAGAIATLVAITQTTPNHFGLDPLALGIAVAIMYTVIRQVEDNLVMPFVIGRTVELHPLLVIFVVLVGASLGGILGLLLAVPAAATLKIILEFLWQKIRAPDPRETLPIGSTTTWDVIARRVQGTQSGRLLLVVAAGVPAPALLEAADYRRLALLAADRQLNLTVITDDPQAAQYAHQAGIVVDLQPAPEFARTVAAAGLTLGEPAAPFTSAPRAEPPRGPLPAAVGPQEREPQVAERK